MRQAFFILLLLSIGIGFSTRPTFSEKSHFHTPQSYLKDALHKESHKNPKLVVDLFIMSQCPYEIKAEKTLIPILKEAEAFCDLRLHFIGKEKKKGEFTSLHGTSEVEENRRQLVISRHFPNKFYDNLLAQAEDYYKDDCVPALEAVQLNKAEIDRLMNLKDEISVYRENIAMSNLRQIYGSPSLYINGTK